MYGKFKVNNQVCYMANALSLVDISACKVGSIVKLYRYETEEELYMVAEKNNRGTDLLMWSMISTQESFDLYQVLGFIPSYEELDLKCVELMRAKGYL